MTEDINLLPNNRIETLNYLITREYISYFSRTVKFRKTIVIGIVVAIAVLLLLQTVLQVLHEVRTRLR
jgi:hypothetical protein